MKVIYAVCSWGLGHATRSLPVIRKLLNESHEITIISNGRALDLLKTELKENASYVDIPDYPLLVYENKQQFIAKSMIYWPLFIQRIEKGLHQLTRLLNKQSCDVIISDGRYDMYNKKIPSYFISHQMRIMNPLRMRVFEKGSERFNLFFFKRFKEIIIPDYRTNDLSGDLSHNLHQINEKTLHYVGILSDFRKRNLKRDIDYFVSLSGPEPQRSLLEQKIRTEINNLGGNIVMTLGKTEEKTKNKNENIEIHTYLSKDERELLLNRSKLVISRSGYSTIMDLTVIGSKALMIPTPGQIEQEYLAEYHNTKKTCYTVPQKLLQLKKDVGLAEKTAGFRAKTSVEDTVEQIMQIIQL